MPGEAKAAAAAGAAPGVVDLLLRGPAWLSWGGVVPLPFGVPAACIARCSTSGASVAAPAVATSLGVLVCVKPSGQVLGIPGTAFLARCDGILQAAIY